MPHEWGAKNKARRGKLSPGLQARGRQRALARKRTRCLRCAGKRWYRGHLGTLVDPCDSCLGSGVVPTPFELREREAAGLPIQPVTEEGLAALKAKLNAKPNDRDYTLADAVYELLLNKETQEVWAARWTDGHLSGAIDVTYDDGPHPTRDQLPTLAYYPPDKGDEVRLVGPHRDRWVVTQRWTRFISAQPPQWILDRQAITRRNTTEETEP